MGFGFFSRVQDQAVPGDHPNQHPVNLTVIREAYSDATPLLECQSVSYAPNRDRRVRIPR